MYTTPILGGIRPPVTHGDPLAEPFLVPLLRLRGHDRQVILPEDCRVPDCLVCQWRRAGLLDHPTPRVVAAHVVREPASGYACHSSYCPGCSALPCICPPDGYEEAVYEHDYALGHAHGAADGPDNRPSRRWLAEANLDADAYLSGYDAACAGVVLTPPQSPPFQLWDELDDWLPF